MKSYGATVQLIGALDPDYLVTPTEAKSFIKKNATKREVIDWAYAMFPNLDWFKHQGRLQDKNEHMADAIAVAYFVFKKLKNI